MLPPYSTVVKTHRFLVKFMIVLGLVMLVTGTLLRYPGQLSPLFPFVDLSQVLWLHSNTSVFFAPTLLLMIVTGVYMYYYPVVVKFTSKRGERVRNWTVQFKEKRQQADGTISFFFEKPAGFSHKAGQYLTWNLVNPPESDARGNSRQFTLSSAPYEPSLALTTRMRDSAFKRVLAAMPPGTPVEIIGPEGDFTLPESADRRVVFLAGGIGITPFRSMVLEATHDATTQEIYLFYSNRIPQEAAFLNELTDLAKKNSNFHFIPTMTQDPTWKGEKGYIDEKMLLKYLRAIKNSLFYLAGPPAMVASMREMLTKTSVKAENIMQDNFTGY